MNDEKLTTDDIACLISGIDKPSKCDDCISRQAVLDIIHLFFAEEIIKIPTEKTEDGDVLTMGKLNPFIRMNKTLSSLIKELPSVTAEQTHEEWCTDCKEYDQEQHCCHRYCRVIRQTVDEIKQAERTGHCKDCKWWKDSDGVYRRGAGAESKCPINNVSVNHGLGYCYMFEPQESDHKSHTCKHYTSGEYDGSCGSYICKGFSNWERSDKE